MSKRKKQYFSDKNTKKRKEGVLDCDVQGFLITCNMREREATREAFNILNETADRLLGPVHVLEEEDDVDASFSKELASMKQLTEKRFKVLDTGVTNILFMKTNCSDPSALFENILQQFLSEKTKFSRYIMRMLPVAITCKANDDKLRQAALKAFHPFFGGQIGHSYGIIYKTRYNSSGLTRSTVFEILGQVIMELNSLNFVKLKDPEFTISVDVIRSICCLSICPEFSKYAKYNLQEINSCKLEEPDGETSPNKDVMETHDDMNSENNLKPDSGDNLKPDSGDNLKLDSENKLKQDSEANLKLDSEDNLKLDSENNLKSDSEDKLKPDSEDNLKLDSEDNLKLDSEDNLKPDSEDNLKLDSKDNLKIDSEDKLKLDFEDNLKPDCEDNLNPDSEDE